jgi:DNA-binding NarL/FixJ family response regulator
MTVGVASRRLLVRKALCALVAQMPEFRVALDVDDSLASLDLLQQIRPDILLLDVLNSSRDLGAIPQLRRRLPRTNVLVLSDLNPEEFQVRVIEAGAQGCVSIGSEPGVLERALRVAGQGEIWVNRKAAGRIIRKLLARNGGKHRVVSELTERESEILALVAKGQRNREIAGALALSENTVRTHLYTIFKKLGVSTRMRAALQYFQRSNAGQERPPRTSAKRDEEQPTGDAGTDSAGSVLRSP